MNILKFGEEIETLKILNDRLEYIIEKNILSNEDLKKCSFYLVEAQELLTAKEEFESMFDLIVLFNKQNEKLIMNFNKETISKKTQKIKS